MSIKNLMIVESPAKAKTIEKYLGDGFTVKSSYGHIRDLPRGSIAIDVDNNYTPEYEVPKDKKDLVKELKKLAKEAEAVWLATDEDREGEAISWHLCEELGLNVANTKRIVFHEITKKAIQSAVQNPRIIDMNLVNAQQARRVLDRLVGFKISPILWRKITRSGSLSAGRVQSVALRLVVEREKAIKDFEVKSYFKISAIFIVEDANGRKVELKAELPKKFELEGDANAFLEKCNGADFTIEKIEVKPAKKRPPAPFTTSTLQQDASRKFGFSVARTMSVAQRLYEAGLITYMRTDSVSLSDTAVQAATEEINSKYGESYVQNRQYKNKSSNAQEAHEAIRPAYMDRETAGDTPEQEKLYKLIRKRALASQMKDAEFERTTATIGISTTDEKLVAKGEVLTFDGFLKIYRESFDDEVEDDSGMLPPLSVGQLLNLRELFATERFSRPPARFTEASLVKKLEELAIGRPSTYAPTISTIQKRNYVVKESREGSPRNYTEYTLYGPASDKSGTLDKLLKQENHGVEKSKLFPTDMGRLVSQFLVQHFENIMEYSFTANIEKEFDEIAQGKMVWNNMIDEFYKPFHIVVEETMETAERVTGQRELGVDPKSGKKVYARLGKFGPMVQIGEVEDEEKPKFASIRPPHTLDSVTFEQAMELFKLPREVGEFEDQKVIASQGRFGPYLKLGTGSNFFSIKEDDPYTIGIERAIEVIKEKREADAKKIIKLFDEDPEIQILNGRWGPYIKAGKKNVKIPKEQKETPEALTFEEVSELIKNAPEKKSRARKKKS